MSVTQIVKGLVLAVGLLLALWGMALGFTWLGLAERAALDQEAHASGTHALSRTYLKPSDFVGNGAEGGDLSTHEQGVAVSAGEKGAALGLRLHGTVLDARAYSRLRLVGGPDRVPVTLIVAESLAGDGADQTFTSEPLYLNGGELTVAWSTLRWYRSSNSEQATSAPQRIAMLRLWIPPEAEVWLGGIEFLSEPEVLPARMAVAADVPRPEAWLLARYRALDAQPGAIIVPPGMPATLSSFAVRLITAAAALVLVAGLFWYYGRFGKAVKSARWIILPLLLPVLLLAIGESWNYWLLIPLAMCLWTSWYLELPETRSGSSARAWYEALLLTAFALSTLLLLQGSRPALDLNQVTLYVAWAFLQQWLLQTRVYAALRTEFSADTAAWTAATAFALLHTPNLALMVLSLLGGRMWCWHYERHHRWLPVAVSHAVLGLAAMNLLPAQWLLGGEVSARFFMMP